VSQDFLLQVFSWIIFPQAPEHNIRVISVFLENSWRYSQVKVHHRYQRHHVANLPPVSTTLDANLPPVPLVSLIPVAGINDTSGKKWEQYQTADTLK
jgi:hypothetical protein